MKNNDKENFYRRGNDAIDAYVCNVGKCIGGVTGFSYSVNSDGNTVTITKYNGSDTDVVIPDTIDGKAVTAIGDKAFRNTNIKSVEIRTGVKSIGKNAFKGSGLTSVTIPSSVTSIGNSAFQECAGLESVTVPATVMSVGTYIFKSCTGLKSATVLCENLSQSMFRDCTNLTDVTLKNTKSIGKYVFHSCGKLKDVAIPDGVTSIGQSAFWNCKSMVKLTIPKSVTSIGDTAFVDCTGLKSVTLSKTHINRNTPDGIFDGCSVDEVYFDGGKRQWKNTGITTKHMYYYTTDAGEAQTEYVNENDKATGFVATIKRDDDDLSAAEEYKKLMWRITPSDGEAVKAEVNLNGKLSLETGASATFGIVLDGLCDENATATISAEVE